MAELAPRLRCPVCLAVPMAKVRVGQDAPVEIDRCARCAGVWLEYGEVQLLRRQPAAAFWIAVGGQRSPEMATPCHDCHSPFQRNLPACPGCGWKNVLDCPCCGRPMKRESRGGIALDVCHGCKGAWFDRHELNVIWTLQASMALERRSAGTMVADAGATTGEVMLDVLFYAPDLAYGAAHAVSGIAQVAAHVPEMAAAAPEGVIFVVQAAGEAAGGVFHVIVSIFEGVFGLLDF